MLEMSLKIGKKSSSLLHSKSLNVRIIGPTGEKTSGTEGRRSSPFEPCGCSSPVDKVEHSEAFKTTFTFLE